MYEQPPQMEVLLEEFQRAAFGYFLEQTNPANGLVADTSLDGSPASIASVGFALSSFPVGVERGWMVRADAVARTLAALRFFWNGEQSDKPEAIGYKGFYYHFLDMHSGKRVWNCEVSLIDTTLLVAGILTAAVYFDAQTPDETEIRELADALYRRVDWRWAESGKGTVTQGWKPHSGFLHYDWDGYNEATILYILGLASPTHPLSEDSYAVRTTGYQWENIYDIDFLYAGPLFIHQFSHAWIDFRGIRDPFMREKDCDYFENSRRATYIQREYAERNPHGFDGYGKDCWGVNACDGPGEKLLEIDGKWRKFSGYAARGVPFGPDDGTIAPWSALASLPFAPEIAFPALQHLCEQYPEIVRDCRMPSGFNPTLPGKGRYGWVSDGFYGLSQGIIVLMVENHRSGLIWKLMRQCRYIREGLRRGGFRGGWL